MDESAEKELAEVKPGRERRPPFTLRDIQRVDSDSVTLNPIYTL